MPKRLRGPLEEASAPWHGRRAGPAAADSAGRVRRPERAVAGHLRDRSPRGRDGQRLWSEPGRCDGAGSPVRLLDGPGIGPTTDRAERALRPAVIGREVSRGTKDARGARASEAWTSVVRALSRATSGPALLDAVARITHPAVPQPS